MDQVKIGKFIAERRKAAGLTQMQLAERLLITDRAVSKWENGRSLPDSSIMLELCSILGISVNELLCGEVVSMENYNKELEKNLIEMVKQKEAADKRLLFFEYFIGGILVAVLLGATAIAAFVEMEEWLRAVIIILGLVPILAAAPFMLKIEQTAGYYECAECGHRYVPSYKSVFGAMHFGRTRHLKCPKCNKRSWNKKVIGKN